MSILLQILGAIVGIVAISIMAGSGLSSNDEERGEFKRDDD